MQRRSPLFTDPLYHVLQNKQDAQILSVISFLSHDVGRHGPIKTISPADFQRNSPSVTESVLVSLEQYSAVSCKFLTKRINMACVHTHQLRWQLMTVIDIKFTVCHHLLLCINHLKICLQQFMKCKQQNGTFTMHHP